jgi:hypothetical protein
MVEAVAVDDDAVSAAGGADFRTADAVAEERTLPAFPDIRDASAETVNRADPPSQLISKESPLQDHVALIEPNGPTNRAVPPGSIVNSPESPD